MDAADDITRKIMGRVAYLIAHGGLYDDQGRSLKVFHYIYSRRENDDNLKAARKRCKEDVREHGLDAGYIIIHPYRGTHNPKATPAECRDAMDRESLSIHVHGVAIGYWSLPSESGVDHYYHADKLIDVRDWIDPDRPIDLRIRLLSHLQYDLGHAGYYGEKGQCVTFFGPHHENMDSFIPPQPQIALKHPSMEGPDGGPIWEQRRVPKEDAWEDLRGIEAELIDGDQSVLDSRSYIEHMPRGGQIGTGEYLTSNAPWYALDEIEREEWHENWYVWRSSIALAIRVLMIPHRYP